MVISVREVEWENFADEVAKHVTQYTVPQYGDFPSDIVSKKKGSYLREQIQKYAARLETNQRGKKEELRDLMKMAHYCAMLYNKIKTTGGDTAITVKYECDNCYVNVELVLPLPTVNEINDAKEARQMFNDQLCEACEKLMNESY